jgi:hypothetical protein
LAIQGVLAKALLVDHAAECAGLLADVSDRFDVFAEALPPALRGEWPAVVVLVNRWRWLVDGVLAAAAEVLPGLVRREGERFALSTGDRRWSDEPINYLYGLIGDVPFSPLVTEFGPGIGVAVAAVDAVRSLLPGRTPLGRGESSGWPALGPGADAARFRRLVDLAGRATRPPLSRVKELFALTNGELAQLFAVSRQAVEQWERSGEVPAARREKLGNVLSVGELLERKLSPGRLPLVARRRADAYGGVTMLDMVALDRDEELRRLTEEAFDWSATA